MKLCITPPWHSRSNVRVRTAAFFVAIALTFGAAGMMTSFTSSFAQSASNSLPEDVAAMREAILEAAQSGDLEELGAVIELNELPPDFGGVDGHVGEPLAALRSLAPLVDGDGVSDHDVKRLLNILEGLLSVSAGRDGDLYVWPSVAVERPSHLSEADKQKLGTFMTADAISRLAAGAAYEGYRLDIGPDGTWHYFGVVGTSAK